MTTYRRYYDEAEGDPGAGIMPDTLWRDIPDTWKCPGCGADKADFGLMK